MGDHDVPDPAVERGVDDGEDLVAAEMARRQQHPVARDRLQHLVGLRQHASGLVHDRHRIDPNALLVKLVLELCPRGRRGVRLTSLRFVQGIDRREPDRASALACRNLHGQRVHPAHRAIKRDPSEHLDIRDGLPHDARSLRRRGVMRLQHEPGQSQFGKPPRQGNVVDSALHHIGGDVHMRVERALHQTAGAFARDLRHARLGALRASRQPPRTRAARPRGRSASRSPPASRAPGARRAADSP